MAVNRRHHQTPNHKGRARLFSAKPSGITSYQVVNSTTHQEEQSSHMMPSVQAMLAYENLQQSPTSASDLLSMPQDPKSKPLNARSFTVMLKHRNQT